MLEPPQRSQSITGNDCGNMLIDKNISPITVPGERTVFSSFTPRDLLYVAMPLPHVSELVTTPVNPLLCDHLAPSNHTSGVRISHFYCDAASKSISGRKRPKTSLFRNKSNYMSQSTVYDRLHRLLKLDNDIEGMWVSVGRSIQLLPFAPVKSETLLRVLFTKAWPLCHCPGLGLEIICGMSSGDIIWVDAASGKYSRINKSGNLTRAAVTAIKLLDAASLQVVAGHADGSVVIYALDRDDGPDCVSSKKLDRALLQVFSNSSGAQQNGVPTNPIRAFKVSNTPITDISVLGNQILTTSRDGYLRFLDVEHAIVGPIIGTSYGGLFALSISPDNKFLITGGENDIISLYAMGSMQLVATFVGHSSWVRRAEFDVFDCDLKNQFYRFCSVGEDGKMLFWEFGPEMLFSNAKVTNIYPRAEVRPHELSKSESHGVPLSDLMLLQETVSAVGSDGRVWTWARKHLH